MSPNHAADPRRALSLLWRGDDRLRPGPKPALDLDRIVQAAIEIADYEGVDALTMRRVATALGVGPASLYTYVPGRPELIALMLDEVAGYCTLPHTFPGGWRDQIDAWAREDWAEFHRHPWVIRVVTGRALPGPKLLAWYDSALTVLAETGLSEPEKIAVIETVDAYVRGHAWTSVGETTSTDGGVTRAASSAAWHEQRDAALGELVDFRRFPAMARSLMAGATPSVETFELGLVHLLDGIEALIERRRT